MTGTKNIVLIGFMGSGKSSTSRALSQLLKQSVVSTDEIIIQKEKKSITKIFQEKGEESFRSLERQAVEEISRQSGVIVDCGGGVVKDPRNIVNLKKNGIVIYLNTSPEWIHRRTKNSQERPLLNVPDPMKRIEKLLKEREPFYAQADISVFTDGKTPEEVAEEIVKLLKK